jgi:hypothetical protein
MHQPAWSLFDAITLAGIHPTRRGYRIDPQLPMRRFSLRLPRAGVAYSGAVARGYLRPSGHGRLRMAVSVPRWWHTMRVSVFVDGRRTASRVRRGVAGFTVRAAGGKAVSWAVVRG